MNKEMSNQTDKKQWTLYDVMHRLFRFLFFPTLILTLMFIAVCSILSLPLWILTGKTIINWSCELFTKQVEYCTNGT